MIIYYEHFGRFTFHEHQIIRQPVICFTHQQVNGLFNRISLITSPKSELTEIHITLKDRSRRFSFLFFGVKRFDQRQICRKLIHYVSSFDAFSEDKKAV